MTTCGIGEGKTITCKRLRQLNKSGKVQPDKVIIDVDVPKDIKMYYEGTSTINRHNRIHVAKLRMDRNLATKHWDKRFNLGILGIVCVNAYLFSQQVVHADNRPTSCLKFYGSLADELINNTKGICMTRGAAKSQVAEAAVAVEPPTMRWTIRAKIRKGAVKEGIGQGRCGHKSCKEYTYHVCSKCTHATDVAQKQFWYCNPTTKGGSQCFTEHVREKHEGG
jgi:hypothetical protein